MDLAKQLVRSCVRAFYQQPNFDVRHILVIDALVIHSAYVSCQVEEAGDVRLAKTLLPGCATMILHTFLV